MQRILLTATNQREAIKKAVRVLAEGGLIIYPTETCYGVGVDATNPDAVKKLLAYKDRPEGKAISVAVADEAMAREYVDVNETAQNLYENFLPGPITVISESKHKIAPGIEAEDGSLGIRIPNYPFTLELIKQFGKPITATSANLSGRKTPYAIKDILDNTSEKNRKLIDLVIDAGELPHNPPSTVVDTRLNDERILREGSIRFQNRISNIPTSPAYGGIRRASKNQKDKSNIKNFITKTPEETQNLGEKLMKNLLPKLQNKCVVFALQGELGAGKTQFAKGVARALGIKENVTSPTFTLIKEYEFSFANRQSSIVNRTLFHIDTWRMQEEKELADLGFEKMIRPGNVIVIEWAEKIYGLLNTSYSSSIIVRVSLDTIGEKERIARVVHDLKLLL